MPRIAISAARIAEMLRAAKAPEPWADPQAPRKIAAAIMDREPKPTRTAWDRAREAVDELRRVLPQLAEQREKTLAELAARGRSDSRIADMVRADRDAIRRLLDTLPEPRVLALPRPIGKPWFVDALRLWHLYRKLVDPQARISRDGPSIRFIAAALKEMGHPIVEPGTIARALQRRIYGA
jgi:DNA-binding TFAR19-related protein (PDSD5 family)